ncbi:MAG: 1-(5-phosphoribosyl)-5-[(5-phosphoribosylamino)methylideneamino]imidazole-4-carboxamide isomerase [Candidatus Omnitrophica bacterium]|nr:1-(5-phosphoribosyl)-5-[(5-phosphoribosylamino)methylideneamino]imidazole-4-carboxamide isomerase [Candidatus Omnitrophota bacterium]
MIIIPAIDIKDGKVVRLFKGQFDQITEYGADPVEMARYWEALGAQYLHVVDLDGARDGKSANREIIKRIAKTVQIPVETGGGIRSREAVEELLNAGIDRVILGTRVVEDREFVRCLLRSWNASLAVSLDCLNGFVAQRGWVETSGIKGLDLARDLADMGLKYIVYTDISRDGTLAGPDIDGLKEVLAVGDLQVIASGGIKDVEDIKLLRGLKSDNLYGVITGKALYEGTLSLEEALKVC